MAENHCCLLFSFRSLNFLKKMEEKESKNNEKK